MAAATTRTFRRWEHEDDRLLDRMWGRFNVEQIAAKLGRTEIATRHRAQVRRLPGATIGTTTIGALARETGYDKGRIRNAAVRLGLCLRRAPRTTPGKGAGTARRWFAVSDAQQTKILDYLARVPDAKLVYSGRAKRSPAGEWGTGRKPRACLGCHRTDRPHLAKGKCSPCYQGDAKSVRPERRRAPPIGQWGVAGRPGACHTCSTSERPHFCGGACRRCYYAPDESAARAARRSSP